MFILNRVQTSRLNFHPVIVVVFVLAKVMEGKSLVFQEFRENFQKEATICADISLGNLTSIISAVIFKADFSTTLRLEFNKNFVRLYIFS